MEMTKFDARAAADRGAWLHLLHPETGEPMMDGAKPCRVRVLGMQSRTAVAIASASLRARNGQEFDISDIEGNHARNVADTAKLIAEFENMSRNGKPMTPDDAEWFLALTMPMGGKGKSFVEQVNLFSQEQAAGLGNE